MKKLSKDDKKFPPPRELCTHCVEWLYQRDVDFNDYPHCSMGGDYDAKRYMDGDADNCSCFIDW